MVINRNYQDIHIVDVKGYDFILSDYSLQSGIVAYQNADSTISVLHRTPNSITVKTHQKEVKIDLSPLLRRNVDKFKNSSDSEHKSNDLDILYEDERIKIKVEIVQFTVNIHRDEEPYSLEARIFIKLKE